MGPSSVNDDLLKESLLELFEQAPCGYLFTAPDGTLLRVNETFLRWTGHARLDLVGKRRFQNLLTVGGRLFYENQYAPLLRLQGFVNEVAFDVLRPTGEPLPVIANAVERRDGLGRPLFIACTLFDASSRRSYERELLRARREAQQLADIVDSSSDAILSASPDGAIQTWNRGAQALLGRAAADVVGEPLFQVLPLAGDEDQWPDVLARLHAGEAVHLETVAVAAGGRAIEVSAGLTPLLGPLRELTRVSLILRDIRERKALERLQQEFLAMASHELRNPLASIKGHAQLMRRRERYNDTGTDAIIAQAAHLDDLVNDLLLASQIAAGRLELSLEPVNLVPEARAAAAAFAAEETHHVSFEGPPGPVTVHADRRRLRQVLANLIGNAIKYSPGGGQVTVSVLSDASGATVSVSDQGVGIPADALPHVFDRFYRARATAGRTQGLGLGLYITHQLVTGHGGTISVESEPGKGSTFRIRLPLAG